MAGQPTKKVQLIQAEFGDESGRQTITNSLKSKLQSSGEINVDSSLLPLIQTEGSIALNPSEIKEAKEKAEAACGGNSNDTACIEKQQQQIQQQLLEDKKNASNSTANIIKGRRLRMVVVGEDGVRRTYEVPDGQVFNPEKLGLKFQENVMESESFFKLPSIGEFVTSFFLYGGSFLLTFLYAVSILTTWQTFRKGGYDMKISAIPTAIAAIFPYSGFFITLGYFLIVRYYLNTKNPLPKTQ